MSEFSELFGFNNYPRDLKLVFHETTSKNFIIPKDSEGSLLVIGASPKNYQNMGFGLKKVKFKKGDSINFISGAPSLPGDTFFNVNNSLLVKIPGDPLDTSGYYGTDIDYSSLKALPKIINFKEYAANPFFFRKFYIGSGPYEYELKQDKIPNFMSSYYDSSLTFNNGCFFLTLFF